MNKAKIIASIILKDKLSNACAKLSFLALFFIISCETNNSKSSEIRSDIRLGNKYYSIMVKEAGSAYVIKGIGSYYTDSMIAKTSDTGCLFKLDPSNVFFEKVNELIDSPIIRRSRTGIAQRAEVYYKGQKIFDSYAWDKSFWDLFRPIMKEIPSGCNPFRLDEEPFK